MGDNQRMVPHAAALSFAALLSAFIAHPAHAQRYDDQCRLLPAPGYVMQPGAPDPTCVQSRREAAIKEQTRTAFERQRCESVLDSDLRTVMSQTPLIESGTLRIIDLERPQFDASRSLCSVRAMTNRGVVPAVIEFQSFNGRSYLSVRMITGIGY